AVVVIDNERYGETGMQDTHTRHGVDLSGIATAAGIRRSFIVYEEEELDTLIPELYNRDGPIFATIKVTAASHPTVLPARDGSYLKSRFRQALLGDKAAE
ncbi:MAG: aldehyde dehydrogenase, partial [Acidiferrobacterales bacterium]